MTNRSKSAILGILYIAYVALSTYWLIKYSGPAYFLGELQLEHFGSYWPVLTMVILQIPAAIVLWLFGRLIGFDPLLAIMEKLDGYPLLQDSLVPLLILLVGAFFFVIGWDEMFAPEVGKVNMEEIELGNMPKSSCYAEVTGYLDEIGMSRRKGSEIPILYLPFRKADDRNQPVFLVVQVQENEVQQYVRRDRATGKSTVRGLISDSPPSEVPAGLISHGVPLADNCRYLSTRANRAKATSVAAVFFVIATSIAGFRFWANRRDRFRLKSAKENPLPQHYPINNHSQ